MFLNIYHFKRIYGAVSEGEAEAALAELNEKWYDDYPSAVKVWNDGFCYVQTLFDYPTDIPCPIRVGKWLHL